MPPPPCSDLGGSLPGRRSRLALLLSLSVLPLAGCGAAAPDPGSAADTDSRAPAAELFRVETVTEDIAVPFGMAFLGADRALVTDRADGRIVDLDLNEGQGVALEGVPEPYTELDGGILDVALHPDYDDNGWIYFSYARGDVAASQTVVARARLIDGRLDEQQELFAALPLLPGASHFGSRLAFAGGYLFIAQGERDHREHGQDLSSHNGKILRLHDDGRVPVDNPFVGRPGARPEIWSWGHRNPQGLAVHPPTGELWSHEHGPMGGDEINRIVAGANYGWPTVSFGNEYSGEPVGDGRHYAEGVQAPLLVWVPSIAPSGMSYYDGDAFPHWRGSFLVGALALRHVNRVRFDGDVPVLEERLLTDRGWRVRFAAVAPDGLVYVGADNVGIVRLRP